MNGTQGNRPKSTIRLSQYVWVSPHSAAALPDKFRILLIHDFTNKPFEAAKRVKLLSTIRFHLVIYENVPFAMTEPIGGICLSPTWKRSELHV